MENSKQPIGCVVFVGLGFLVLISALSAGLAVPTAPIIDGLKLHISASSYWMAFAIWFIVLSFVGWIFANIAWKNVHHEVEEGLQR